MTVRPNIGDLGQTAGADPCGWGDVFGTLSQSCCAYLNSTGGVPGNSEPLATFEGIAYDWSSCSPSVASQFLPYVLMAGGLLVLIFLVEQAK
jgi:hypothetical protein